EEALAAVEEGRICDFKTVYAIQYLMLTQRW
ncbi:MAG: NUDIX hydrolase, partial [Turicibacter sp.]|nr:NUDIX hydrolase [Turicibacter sp.]MCI9351378.1 NUDIX hydrolase [Turicibacter sp.]